MYTKSIIQQHAELLRTKDDFRCMIENLMEKYNIEDSVFVYANNRYNSIYEVTDGYFVTENEYDSISEAVSACDVNTMGIRVMQNSKFQVGKIHKFITECDKDKRIFDLKRLENVR